jgi:chromatin segregation and condensation protein Rec8/ScpA/Scc1 (kleisin family)
VAHDSDEIVRGGKAALVLDSQVFLDAKEHVLEGIQRQMRAVPLADQNMHTRLIVAMQVWDQLEKYLEHIKQTGEIRQFQVQQEEERKRRFTLFGGG